MRVIVPIILVVANVMSSLMFIGLGVGLFAFPDTDLSLHLQALTGIYVVFILSCIFEPVKWFIYMDTIEFKHGKAILLLFVYGIFIIVVSFVLSLFYFALCGLLYVVGYFLLRQVPRGFNIIVEKQVEGEPLASDVLFRPLP